jgi:hypothetical protein
MKASLLHLFLLLVVTAASAQHYRPDRQPLHPAAQPDSTELDRPWNAPSTPEEEAKAREEWDDHFHTRNFDPERATSRKYRKTQSAPYPREKARIGCICMDGYPSDVTGKGACSTRGGVRYWVYQGAQSDTIHWPTWRHALHPGPLQESELAMLVAHRPFFNPQQQAAAGRTIWDFAIVIFGSGSLFALARFLLRRGSLYIIFHHPGDRPE